MLIRYRIYAQHQHPMMILRPEQTTTAKKNTLIFDKSYQAYSVEMIVRFDCVFPGSFTKHFLDLVFVLHPYDFGAS